MSEPIRIELTPEAQALLTRFNTAHTWLPGVIAIAMKRENEFTVRHIQQERMDGNNGIPFPVSEHRLGVRTARLRRSIFASDPEVSGKTVRSTIGSNVVYAASHEFGNHDEVTVPSHLRRRKRTVVVEKVDKQGKTRRTSKRVFGAAFPVRSYLMRMNIEARAPITTGVLERLPALGKAISDDLVKALGTNT